MPIGWYVVPYKIYDRIPGAPRNMRYCAMDDYTSEIRADGGHWAESEVLGNQAIVKVRASVATLSMLDGQFERCPKDRLDDPLADLSTASKNRLKNLGRNMGYSTAEIRKELPNDLGSYTLRDVLKLFSTKRKKPRYDPDLDAIILDGPDQKCRPVESVDSEIKE